MDFCGGEGWCSLCQFLGVDEPVDKFPNMNSSMGAGDLDRLAEPFFSEVEGNIAAGAKYILIDQDAFRSRVHLFDANAVPFVERNGQYWGLPSDDERAIFELKRLRKEGAGFLVVGWPAFWWLDYYVGLRRYLESAFACTVRNERLMIFDLR
jgi:hypothetical protein